MPESNPYVITIVGAESSGKTRLAMQLANYFQCPWVPEYAREYLAELGRPYAQEDLEVIAERELERIIDIVCSAPNNLMEELSDEHGPLSTRIVSRQSSVVNRELLDLIESKIMLRPASPHPLATAQQPSKIIIVDGGMMTLRMWARIKYQIEIPIVEKALENDVTDLYLLCRPRKEWEPDPFREAPGVVERAWIYNQYLQELSRSEKSVEVVIAA